MPVLKVWDVRRQMKKSFVSGTLSVEEVVKKGKYRFIACSLSLEEILLFHNGKVSGLPH